MHPVPLTVPPVLAHQSTLREANLGVVLRSVCAAEEPLSRAGVAADTGLTRSTVSRLVDELVAGGLLEEGTALLAGPGRPATPLLPSSGVGAVGLQINAAHVAARLIDLRGRVVAESRSEPDLVGSEPATGLALLGEHLSEVLAAVPVDGRVLGAGLALPGVVDAAGERLLRAPNLGWRDLDPGPDLRARLDGIPLSLANEANLAAHAFAQPAPGGGDGRATSSTSPGRSASAARWSPTGACRPGCTGSPGRSGTCRSNRAGTPAPAGRTAAWRGTPGAWR